MYFSKTYFEDIDERLTVKMPFLLKFTEFGIFEMAKFKDSKHF